MIRFEESGGPGPKGKWLPKLEIGVLFDPLIAVFYSDVCNVFSKNFFAFQAPSTIK